MQQNNKDDVITTVMMKLKEKLEDNEIFLSECDFQFSFAQELKEEGYNVILEYPIKKEKLYNLKKDTTDNTIDSNSYIDIFCTKEDAAYFIELKYKTLPIENIQRYGMPSNLKGHTCHTQNRKSVYIDIERIEHCLEWYKDNKNIKDKKKYCKGYVVFLTNCKNYKTGKQKEYILRDEESIKNYPDKNVNDLKINGNYKNSWSEGYKELSISNKKNDKFEYLSIEVINQ